MKFSDFMYDYFFGFVMVIFLFGLIGLIFVGEYDIYISNKNSHEKECYAFYKENNYILEECSDFKDKLK